MADEPAQITGPERIGSINHLRLTVTDISRAERFYGPFMRFMGYVLADRGKDRVAWAKWSESGVFWLILSEARQDTVPTPPDALSPGFHHLAWNADSRDQVDGNASFAGRKRSHGARPACGVRLRTWVLCSIVPGPGWIEAGICAPPGAPLVLV